MRDIYKARDEYKYVVYFYDDPTFLFLDDEDIVDINIEGLSYPNGESIGSGDCILEYNCDFFGKNLEKAYEEEFSVTIQVHNKMGQFLQQIEFQGGDIEKKDGVIKFRFDQMSRNHAWPSINPRFTEASEIWKKAKMSYLRDKKIDTLLK